MENKPVLVALCREINYETGEIAVYRLESEVTNDLLWKLKIRHLVNPELRYFAMYKTHFEKREKEIFRALKRQQVTPATIEALGGIVEL